MEKRSKALKLLSSFRLKELEKNQNLPKYIRHILQIFYNIIFLFIIIIIFQYFYQKKSFPITD